ncbi:prepilin-type N-terminal cleavage/methylation domain-containing protein [Rugamonas sp.]|uniref:prepilin-type N-terminal cleavage/methylation domain-containing protein n=1 Tax=Rugamonas sp. TaxID=1926287 RepID=UPI0025DF3309|nr:prepilin-type N-terminal cleavage/methylation domain-containing protein [Rugamonas sp.]
MSIRSTKQPWRQARGLSLIELILFMVIMGIAAAGVLQVLSMSAKGTADPVRRKQGMLIAEALLEEIESARMTYCDPADPNVLTATSPAACTPALKEQMGPETAAPANNVRPYDNVNDYQNVLNPGAAITTDASGAPFGTAGGGAQMNGYSAVVSITDNDTLGPSGMAVSSAATNPMELLRITVTVTYSPGETVVVDGYRARYAPNSVP